MRKLFSILLVIFMLASLLVGCGSKEPAVETDPATESAAEPAADELAAEPELKETVTVRMSPMLTELMESYLWA